MRLGETTETVLVAAVGGAGGAREAAAALACAASLPERPALLVELREGRPPRPSLLATAAARRLEERLASHLPGAAAASRGAGCRLALPPERAGVERLAAALPLLRGSTAVVQLPPRLLQAALAQPGVRPSAALLRADLHRDRSLVALAARDLIGRGVRVAVLKRPLPWLAARAALLGFSPPGATGLPPRLVDRLLQTPKSERAPRTDSDPVTQLLN